MPMLVYGKRGQPLKVEPVVPVSGVDIREDRPKWKVAFSYEFDRYTNEELVGVWDAVSKQIDRRIQNNQIDQETVQRFWPLQKYLDFRKKLRENNDRS